MSGDFKTTRTTLLTRSSFALSFMKLGDLAFLCAIDLWKCTQVIFKAFMLPNLKSRSSFNLRPLSKLRLNSETPRSFWLAQHF